HGAVRIISVETFVNPVNDAPVANDDTFLVLEDTPTKLSVLANDNDIEDVLFAGSITDFTNPAHGVLQINYEDGTITYTPDENFELTDSFIYTITDSDGATSQATVNIVMSPVNDAPVSVSLDNSFIDENIPGGIIGSLTVAD